MDHIFTNTNKHTLQLGIINIAKSGNSMIYSSGQIQKKNTINTQNLTFQSLKSYSVDLFKKALQKCQFLIMITSITLT